MCGDMSRRAHFLIRKGIFDKKYSLERLRSHEHSMEYIDATLTFSRRTVARKSSTGGLWFSARGFDNVKIDKIYKLQCFMVLGGLGTLFVGTKLLKAPTWRQDCLVADVIIHYEDLYRNSQSGQSMRTISEISSASNVWFRRDIYCWARTGV